VGTITEFEPAGASFEALYDFLATARRENPVFFSKKHNGWIVTRYDDLVAVVRSPNFTVENALQGAQSGQYCPEANRILGTGVDWNKTRHVQTDDGPEHSRFRKALMSVITPKRIREMHPIVENLVTGLIDKFIDKGECEFVGEFAYPLAMQSTLNLIGFKEAEDDMSKFSVWINDTFRMLLANLSPEEQVVAATHAVEFQEYIRAKIAARKAKPQDDLLSEILENLSSGAASLSEDELIIMMTHSFVGAGQETTKLALTNSMYHLLSHRERWQELLSDRSRVPEFVEECLRFDAPLLAWYRYCAADTEIGGKPIRRGDLVIIMYGSANHDEERFSDAEKFCPVHSKKAPHLTFNTGKHSCVGAPLARLELTTALSSISGRIPGIRLRPNQQIAYAPNFGNRDIPKLYLEWDVAERRANP
jgi:cytochrome P450